GVSSNGRHRREPHAVGQVPLLVTAAAMLREQHASLVDKLLIDIERPRRRPERGDLFLQELQTGELDGVAAKIDRAQNRSPAWTKVGEHAEHLAGISSDRVDIETVGNAAIPLRPVLP